MSAIQKLTGQKRASAQKAEVSGSETIDALLKNDVLLDKAVRRLAVYIRKHAVPVNWHGREEA